MLILLDFKCLPPEGVQWVSIHMSQLKTYFMNKLTQEPTGIPTHCPSRGRLWGFVGGSSSAAVFVVGKDGLMGAWWVNLCFTHLSAGNSVLSKSVALSYCLLRKLWIERSTWKSRHSRVTTVWNSAYQRLHSLLGLDQLCYWQCMVLRLVYLLGWELEWRAEFCFATHLVLSPLQEKKKRCINAK